MPFDIGHIAEGIVDNTIGAGLGLLLEKHNDKRQLNQQQKLTNMQLNANKEMAGYNYDRQLQMWKDTNYGAQKAELQKAGLNPGLMYGMSGGGGTVTGSGGGGIGAGTAPVGGGEVMGMMMNKMQMEMMKAQIDNIKADTSNKQATTPVINLDEKLKQFELDIKNETRDVAIERIQAEAVKIDAEMQIAKNNRKISDDTFKTEIEAKRAELAGIYLRNEQVKAQTNLTDEQAKEVIQSIQTQIKQLQQGDEHIQIQKVRNELIKTGIWVGAGTQIVGDIINILKTPKKLGETVTEVFDDGHGSKTISTRRH